MKKAVAAVLLAVLLVCAVFSSCGKKEDGAVTGNGNTTRSAAQNAVTNAGDAVGDAVTGAGDVVGDVVLHRFYDVSKSQCIGQTNSCHL